MMRHASCYLPLAALVSISTGFAELKKADFVGSWQPVGISGKKPEDFRAQKLHFRADGTIQADGQEGVRTWHYACTGDGLQLLLMDDGGGDGFMVVVAEIKDGEMTWRIFRREDRLKPLKPDQVAYRFRKLPE